MKITSHKHDLLNHSFEIALEQPIIHERVDTRLHELARQARLPGFRPGKVPVKLIRQRTGKAILGEVVEDLCKQAVQEALEQHQITPAQMPSLVPQNENFIEQAHGDLLFDLKVEALPVIELQDFSTLEVEYLKFAATEDTARIDAMLEQIAAEQEQSEPASDDAKAADGDYIVVDYTGYVDRKPLPGGEGKGVHIKLGSGRFPADFEQGAIGITKGETRTIESLVPEDAAESDLAGKTAHFELQCSEVRHPIKQELNDQMAINLGLENLDSLRNAIKQRLQHEDDVRARNLVKRRILDQLDQAYKFPLPESLTREEFDTVWAQIEQAKSRGQLDPDEAAKSDDALRKDYQIICARRVKLGLIIQEIAKTHTITVSQAELSQAIVRRASALPEKVRDQYMQLAAKDRRVRMEVENPILEEKVLDFILESARLTERELAREEFEQIERNLDTPNPA